MKYEILAQEFLKKNCQLKLTSKEFDSIKSLYKTRLYFVAQCGHDSSANFSNFKYCNNGVICKNCIFKKESRNQTSSKRNNFIIEAKSFDLFYNSINQFYDAKKTNEGCLADMIVKPKQIQINKWLNIQLKSTQGLIHNKYSFKIYKNDYKDCIIVCIALNDKKIWMIPNEKVKHLNSITIGKTNSIYNNFQVDNKNILSVLNKYYEISNLIDIQQSMVPLSLQSCQELEYAKRRVEKIDFFRFEKPPLDGCVYDFILNGFKHQEKVSTFVAKKDYYIVNLGKHGKIKTYRNQYYQVGDNDFYWFWIKDSTLFYVVPELILLNQHCIAAKNESKGGYKMMCLYPHRQVKSKYNFLNDFKFDLDNLNQEKIKKLLKPTVKQNSLLNVDLKLQNFDVILAEVNNEEKDIKDIQNNKNIRINSKDIKKVENNCIDCNIIITRRANRCEICHKISTRKAERPSKELLLNQVKENGYIATGRKYGVSDNAIRKWLK
jgi:hypothetical protein